MNAARLLEHFDRISDATDAVPRLRRLVLDLAVRGRLLPVAAAWSEMTVGDLGAWGSGGTPLKTHAEYYDGDIPWLVIGDLNDGVVTSATTHITQAGLDNSSAKLIDPGAVLIALYGSIGKLGITGIRCATNQAMAHCVPDEKIVTRDYLFLLLRSMRESLLARGQGVAQQNISQKILKAERVEIPPLAEQHRIVAKVDELMALCDRLEAAQVEREARRDRLVAASLAHVSQPAADDAASDARAAGFHLDHFARLTTRPEHVKHLRQTILNLAVRGRLVPQDPLDQPSSAAAGAAQQEDTPFEIPPKWRWLPLRSLGTTHTGTTPAKSRTDFYGNDVPFVRPGHISDASVTYSDDGLTEAGAVESGRLALPGSLLMVCIGTIGKCQVVDRRCCFNQQINALIPNASVDPRFLLFACRSEYFQARAIRDASRTTIAILNKGKWERLPIPLPPLAEQRRIVAKVDELVTLCDQLEASLAAAATDRARLLESLLHEALAPAA